MTRTHLLLAAWTLLAGAGIPLIGPLNAGMARSVGNPIAATAMMFGVAFVAALALTLALQGVPDVDQIRAAPIASYGAGLLIGFYALSATIIIPRLGAGNFVAFILVAQLLTAAVIDQFGLFDIARRPIDLIRVGGLVLILGGIVLMQLPAARPAGGIS